MALENTRWPYGTLAQAEMEGAIAAFQGPHRWLSNFVGASTIYGRPTASVEAGFVAAKLVPPSMRDDAAGHAALRVLEQALGKAALDAQDPSLSPTWRAIDLILAMPAAQAKKIGRALPLRPDWETARPDGLLVKEWTLLTLTRRKYAQNPDLRAKLLATGPALILEGNTWGDTRWGVIDTRTGVQGANRAGLIAMAVREECGGRGVPEDVPAALPRYAGRGLEPAPAQTAPQPTARRGAGMER